MQLEILSQQAYLLSELRKLFGEYCEKATSGSIEQGVTTANDIFLELIRVRMRENARNAVLEYEKPDEFLRKTMHACIEELNQHLGANVSTAHFLDLDKIFDNLRLTARELVKLSENLATSKRIQKAGERRQLPVSHEQRIEPIEMVEIGLQGTIEGLLIRPLGAQCKLNLDHLGNSYSLSGDWFPFEITKGDLLFVVDDDGSIFISTENFPHDLFNYASAEIQALAQRIYSI